MVAAVCQNPSETMETIMRVEASRREVIKAALAALTASALPATIANALPHPSAVAEPCPEFPYFGAHYPDARCIDGYLWDLDAYEDGMLVSGGEVPCPYCSGREYIDYRRDEIFDDGWLAFCDGLAPNSNPFLKGSRFPHLTVTFMDIWRDGYRSAAVNPEAVADRMAIVKD